MSSRSRQASVHNSSGSFAIWLLDRFKSGRKIEYMLVIDVTDCYHLMKDIKAKFCYKEIENNLLKQLQSFINTYL